MSIPITDANLLETLRACIAHIHQHTGAHYAMPDLLLSSRWQLRRIPLEGGAAGETKSRVDWGYEYDNEIDDVVRMETVTCVLTSNLRCLVFANDMELPANAPTALTRS